MQTAKCVLNCHGMGAQFPQIFYWPCQKQAVEADLVERERGLGNSHPSAAAQVTLSIMCLLGSALCLGQFCFTQSDPTQGIFHQNAVRLISISYIDTDQIILV